MAGGRDDGSGDRRAGGSRRRGLANQRGLEALGDAVTGRAGGPRRKKASRHRTRRVVAWTAVGLAFVLVAVLGGGYLYVKHKFDDITKITIPTTDEVAPISGQPFNILVLGSDSRKGLTGLEAAQTGANTGGVDGQRSDVVKVVHVDPNAGTISIVSIPRDTMVTLLAQQSLYGNFNRINVALNESPGLVAKTITANFGIPINYTVVVSFAGLINAADAVGGVYLDFPYPSFDPESGLEITHAGCQLIKGFPALALSRSRHFYYNVKGVYNVPAKWWELSSDQLYTDLVNSGWDYDGTSDFGRIDRQNAFLRAMVDQFKKLYNPLRLNSFLSAIPQGVELDKNISLDFLIGLAERFHGINPANIATYTLPVVDGQNPTLGDVLFASEPATQQMLVNIFGHELVTPTNPFPNQDLQTPLPPYVPFPTTTTSTTTSTTRTSSTSSTGGASTSTSTTTTSTIPQTVQQSFDPRPCAP